MDDHERLTEYGSKADAIAAAKTVDGRPELRRVWHCPVCGRWHTESWRGWSTRVAPADASAAGF